jgi:molybdate transport system substrate-binding protein
VTHLLLIGIRAILVAAATGLAATAANAAELKVISAGAVRSVIGGMIEEYARTSGHKFSFVVGPTGMLRSIIASGEAADLVIVSAPLMEELEKTGKLTAGSRVDLGRIGMGVVIRDGARAPKITTAEELKQTLINASSIAYTDPARGGTSYLHLMKIAEQFGIADAVRKKGVHATGGNDAADKVAHGEAEIAIVLISEIGEAKGAKLLAPLPEALQLYTLYAAAIPASSKEPTIARAFVTALTGPTLRARWAAAGWEPVAK